MSKLLVVLSFILAFYLAAFLITPFKTETGNRSLFGYLLEAGLLPINPGPCCKVSDITKASTPTTAPDVAQANIPPGDFTLDSLEQKPDDTDTNVLGVTTDQTGAEKWIDVDLKTQTLTAYEGDKIFKQFKISSGIANSTPKGTYYIWYKTRRQIMSGGSKELGTYYYLPNVPYNMFFKGPYAIHGAYWHHNWGHPMSHGCVNAPIDMSGELFDWTGPVVQPDKNWARATKSNPGTKIVVHDG